jgi:hypothetical protein
MAQIGAKNWEVTDGVAKVLKEYEGAVKGVEGKSPKVFFRLSLDLTESTSRHDFSSSKNRGIQRYSGFGNLRLMATSAAPTTRHRGQKEHHSFPHP